MASLDTALRTLVRAAEPQNGLRAAADAQQATEILARLLGSHDVPFNSLRGRLEALVRLDVPGDDPDSERRRTMISQQLILWAESAYREGRRRR